MGHEAKQPRATRAALALLTASILALLLAPQAFAVGGPFHSRAKALDIAGLNHACGVATDSKGDLYAASAGTGEVKVYNAAHTFLTSIADANQPCGLAVTTTGNLYVSEKATGKVVRFKPNAYPFAGTPTYGAREEIDASGKAKGIAVDRFDDRLYVAEGDRVSTYNAAGSLGIDEVQRIFLFDVTGGTFKLKFGGQETGAIKFDATAAEVKAALEALSSIGAGNVSVEKPQELRWFVTFTAALGHADVEALSGDASGLTGGVKPEVKIEETVKGFSGHIGEGALTEASGVAAYTYANGEKTDRYLWTADANGLLPDRLQLFAGQNLRTLKPRRELSGTTTPDGSFGFGTAGAYLAADPGNRDAAGKCIVLGEPQACTAGHLFLYDAAHKALDEFDASGEYLDQTKNAGFADAEPSAVAVDRSGTANDGTIYVSAGAGAGAKALAFGPLKAPARKVLKKPSEEAGGLSQELANAGAVAVDSHGYVYVAAGKTIHVYAPNGTEVLPESKKFLITDTHSPVDLAVDSTGKVYVLDENNGSEKEEEVTYFTPSAYPPVGGAVGTATTYERHAVVDSWMGFPNGQLLRAIAVNPGPGTGKDHLFVTSIDVTHEYDSAANGSTLLKSEFAKGISTVIRQSLAINGANGVVYFGENPHRITAVDKTGTELLARFENTGAANGKVGGNPNVAVDQSSGHVIEYDETSSAREYDAAGSFVAQFGGFKEGLSAPYRVAIDNACATHVPPLSGEACKAFDPANGTAYVAFADTSATHPPYNGVNAFGPLDYGTAPPTPKYKLTLEKLGAGSGKVTSSPAGIDCGATCTAEYDEDTPVTLMASADPGFEFLGFTGCDAEPSASECEVSMSEAREVTAEFEPAPGSEEFPLEVIVEGPGSGTVTSSPAGIECPSTCTAEFSKNAKVILTVAPAKGSVIAGWTGCDAEPSPSQCEVTITEATEVKVALDFETPLLTVTPKGTGSGEVTSSPAGIQCPASCEAEFELNEAVTLSAKADEGSKFAGFTGCDAEPSPSQCEVTMGEAREVTASFEALPRAIAGQAVPVAYHEATLNGEVNPESLASKYHFEYLSKEEYEANGGTFAGAQQTPVGELAPTNGFLAVKAPLGGLKEGTAYRFRLLAESAAGTAEDEGGFQTLQRRAAEACANAPYRFGLSANLPDCRAYELATPAQTNGLAPEATGSATSPSGGFSNWFTPQRGAGAGERLSYFTNGTLPGFEGNGILDGYRAERGAGDHPAGGWQSRLFSPDYAESAPGVHHSAFQLGVAPDQLYSAWEFNPEPETFPETLPQGVYLSTPAGFEALGQGSLGTDLGALSRYVSAGGAHGIFASKAHLEPEAPLKGNVALYDRAAGSSTAHVLTLPPNNASAEEEAEFLDALRSREQASFQGASEDGSAVVFKAGVGLYVRLDDAITERISPSTARVSDTLRCAAGPLYEGEQEVGGRHFQWLRDAAPIPGAEGNDVNKPPDYTVQAADEGAALQCLTVASHLDPRSVAVSGPVWIAPLEPGQTPLPPAQIAAPTPADPAVGTTETCDPGSWQGAESLAYQWYDDGEPISGASAQTYEVQAADVPGTLQCVVSGTNAAATLAKASGLTPTSPAPAEPAPAATAQAALKTTYASVSEDGRYVFFANGGGKSPGRLFRFDTQAEIATEIVAAGIFASVSPDGSHAFFSSAEALTGSEENENGEEAEAGAHNLYAWDGTTTRFIGGLAASDLSLVAGPVAPPSGSANASTRSSADGGTFAFQSHARLTAYDNEGVGEIYRYQPTAAAGERLLCVSCDPSGAPPSADALLEDTPVTAKTLIASLTEGGQEVFFQSFDRLLPEDANDVEDVYEWKAKGTKGPGGDVCQRPGGCLALISSGQGEVPSFLYAMSGDGHDVFFQTKERLVGMDIAGSPSIYDARIGGGIPETSAASPCQGDACQGQGALAPILPGPASTGGGETPEPPEAGSCRKPKHRVKGRCVAAKHHKKHHRKASHNRRAGR